MEKGTNLSQDQLLVLIDRFQQGIATTAELEMINRWYDSFESDLPLPESGKGESKEEWRLRMLSEIERRISETERADVKKWPLWSWARIAVAAILVVSMGVFFLSKDKEAELATLAAEIVPGANVATLTLEDGNVLTLSPQQEGIVMGDSLRYADGSLLKGEPSIGQSNHRIYQLATPLGGQYQIRLSDGTKVWLNAASTLKYPSHFTDLKERVVELSGEAYFEVARNVRQPFKVKTSQQLIEVLGTSFNIHNYQDEAEVKTTLMEGSLAIRPQNEPSTGSLATVKLKPGEQIRILNGQPSVHQADIEAEIDWKNGQFIFKNESLGSIMKRVSRWYNVEVRFQKGAPVNEYFKGRVSRFEKVHTLLEMLEETGDVHFKVTGRTIDVYPVKK